MTCDFCGAVMGPGDDPKACGHVEGQGGAAGMLTQRCVYCGREIALTADTEHPGQRVFVGHVNGRSNRYCAGAGKFAVYGMHSAAAYDFGAG